MESWSIHYEEFMTKKGLSAFVSTSTPEEGLSETAQEALDANKASRR